MAEASLRKLRARSSGSLRLAWDRARTSLWFIPSLLVVATFALALAMLRIDEVVGSGYGKAWWLFDGGPDGARTVLSVISGSLITVLAVAFSGTMIAIQQASTQFTPRVLRNFTRDRGNQIVLGTYIATFAYALLVLRRVRGENGDPDVFVPAISITIAMVLALLSLVLLVYFIHHISEGLQVSYLMTAIRRELDDELERRFPSDVGASPEQADEAPSRERELPHETTVQSNAEGYLRAIDEREIERAVDRDAHEIELCVAHGEYVRFGDVVARVRSLEAPKETLSDSLASALQLDRDRSVHEDPLFGIRQLVDIALKALSPGINDPTTAEQAIDHLSAALTLLLHREPPPTERMVGERSRVRFKLPTFSDYAGACFAQIRRTARENYHVSHYLVVVLRKLIEQSERPEHTAELRAQIDAVVSGFSGQLSAQERSALNG